MKKLASLLFFSAILASAQTAETRIYRAIMATANEVPPITGLNASGMATLQVHVIRGTNGQITSGSVDFLVNYSFPSEVTITGLHIHNGPAGVNAGVTVNTGLSGTNTITGTSGRIELQAQVLPGNQAGLDTLAGIFVDPSQFYANLHTTVFPGGVIRGQLMSTESVVVMGLMSTANEVPAIPLDASGVGTVTAIVTRNAAGAINSGEVIFDVNYNFPAAISFTGLHVHSGPAGVNAAVTLSSGLVRLESTANGRGTIQLRNEIAVSSAASVAAFEGLFRDPQSYYINLHTTDNPGGVIRAQLRPTDQMRFPVQMSTANEVPAITGLDASATAAVQVNTVRAADGTVQAGFVRYDVNHRFPGQTEFTGLHVHDGAAGVNGPVRLNSGLSGANSVKTDAGSGNIFRQFNVTDDLGLATLNSLVATPSQHYLNLHSTVNPGGVVRNQLQAARTAAPAIGVVIGAVGDASAVNSAPGGLISIFGANLAEVPTDLSGWLSTRLPNKLNGVEVSIGGRAAPILAVSGSEILAQVPLETPLGPQPVSVSVNGASSNALSLGTIANAPAIFFFTSGGVIVRNSDFTVITAENPARAGDILVMFLTGMGQTTPPLRTGELAPVAPLANTAAVTVTIGGQNAEVLYSLATPGLAGVYQTAVRVPAGVSAGSVPVVARMGAGVSNTVTMAVR